MYYFTFAKSSHWTRIMLTGEIRSYIKVLVRLRVCFVAMFVMFNINMLQHIFKFYDLSQYQISHF
jgi:hypothetical protein